MRKPLIVLLALLVLAFVGLGLWYANWKRAANHLQSQLQNFSNLTISYERSSTSLWPQLVLALHNVKVKNESGLGFSADTLFLTMSHWQALIGKKDYKNLVLNKATITAPGGKAQDRLFEFLTSPAFNQLFAGHILKVYNSDIQWQNGQTSRVDSLQLETGEMGQTIRFSSQFNHKGAPTTLDANLQKQGKDAPLWDITYAAQSPLFSLTGSGVLNGQDNSFSGKSRFVSPSLRGFLGLINHPIPPSPGFEVIDLSGQISLNRQGQINLSDMSLKLDGNIGTGALQFGPSPQGIFMQGTLAFDRLALEPYFIGNVPSWQAFIDDLNRWREGWNIDVRLSAQTISLGEGAGSFAGGVVINKTIAELAVGNTNLASQSAQGRIALTSPSDETPRFAFAVQANQLHTEALGRWLPVPLNGLANLTLSGETTGTTLEEVRTNLKAEGELAANKLSLSGLGVAKAIEEIASDKLISTSLPLGKEQTEFSDLSVSFDLENQFLQLTTFSSKIGAWQATGMGHYLTEEKRLALDLTLSADSKKEGINAKLSGQLPLLILQKPAPDQPETPKP